MEIICWHQDHTLTSVDQGMVRRYGRFYGLVVKASDMNVRDLWFGPLLR